MKYLFALLIGFLFGALLFAAGLVYNPFISERALSPIAVSNAQTVTLGFSAVASEGIVYTNNGESRVEPFPEKVQELWEEPIRQTAAMATVMRDARNQVAGFGIKFASSSEQTRLFSGEALVDSVWYVAQSENHWNFLRDVALPAYRSSANTWAGTWFGNLTVGPGALGTARVSGGTGEFAGKEMLGVESLSVRAWRVDTGPVAAEGQLIIELPTDQAPLEESTD